MMEKIMDYLNWLYIGVGTIILGAIGWLVAMGAKAYATKTTSLLWQEQMTKISEEAAKKAVKNVVLSQELKERDKELLESLTKIVINGLAEYPPLVRKEATELLNPLIASTQTLIKSNKINQSKIAKIEKSLKEHRESEHKHRNDTLTVLNFLIDSTTDQFKVSEESTRKIKDLRKKISDELKEGKENYSPIMYS